MSVALLPDRACYDADVTVDRQERVPEHGISPRVRAADVPHLAGFDCLVPLGDSIYNPVPVRLEIAKVTSRFNALLPHFISVEARNLRCELHWGTVLQFQTSSASSAFAARRW